MEDLTSKLLQIGASELDIKLAQQDFCNRICLVKTSPDTDFAFTPGRAGVDETISVNKLWPALKFNSFNDLMNQLNDDFGKDSGRKKAEFTVAARKLVGTNLGQFGFVYLLGKGHDDFLTVLKKNDDGKLIEEGVIFDFFSSLIEMDEGKGYCSSMDFQKASKIAMARLGIEASPQETSGMQVQVANANSAKKSLHMGTQPPQQMGRGEEFSSRNLNDGVDAPVDTVEFNGEMANASDTSSIGAAGEEEQVKLIEDLGSNYMDVADKSTDWNLFWKTMKSDGWTWQNGTGLVSYHYFHARCKDRNKTEVLREGKKGEDYFESIEEVMRYAKKNLGYKGLVESPAPSIGGEKRKRRTRSTVAAATAKTTETNIETRKRRNNARERKKQVKKEGHQEMSNDVLNENEDDDDDEGTDNTSHFSTGALEPPSPTVSEAEMNMGIRSAKKKLVYKKPDAQSEKIGEDAYIESDNVESDVDAESEITESSSEDVTFQIMSSGEAWKLLMKHFGFKYHNQKYCLPGNENKPGQGSDAVEGRHYFPTLAELRKHLCAYGLPQCRERLENPSVIAISRWIRFAHVMGLPDAAFVNKEDFGEYLDFWGAWKMLQELGLTYKGGLYVVENVNDSTEPKKFERQEDMIVHLARFGIPCIPSPRNVGLTEDDRLRLDLYIADTEIDCFKRIDPDKENVNEITPRRSRSKRADAAEAEGESLLQMSPAGSTGELGDENYWSSFDDLEAQRQIDLSQLDSERTFQLLIDHYDFSKVHSYDAEDYGSLYFCFPEKTPSNKSKIGVDFFESLQELREYLCAYGLPQRTKRKKISDDAMEEIEQWIRSAHIYEPYEEAVMTSSPMKRKEVRSILKGLGYRFSKRFQFSLLPDVTCHKSQPGMDRFGELIDLFNHIARFGLSRSVNGENYSAAEIQRLQLFIASVATCDITKQIEDKGYLSKGTSVATLAAPSSSTATSSVPVPDLILSENDIKTPKQVPVVLDQDDTPESKEKTPQKPKAKTLLNYFASGVSSVVKAALTPSKRSAHIKSATSSTLNTNSEAVASNPASSPLECPPSVDETAVDDEVDKIVKSEEEYSLSKSQINLNWFELWHEMRSDGWTYTRGTGTVGYYYVHPRLQNAKKKDVLSGVKGMDYFESEEEIQEFAKKYLGWKGEKEFSTPGETMMSSTSIYTATNKRKDTFTDLAVQSPLKKKARHVRPVAKAASPSGSHQSSGTLSKSGKDDELKYLPLPDQQSTFKDKLEFCKLMLYPGNSQRSLRLSTVVKQLEDEIKLFIIRAIRTGYDIDGMAGQSPGFMYICGGPGTGKTTTVTSCLQNLSKWAKESGTSKPCYCSVNMASIASMDTAGMKKEMLRSIAKKLEIDKKSSEDVFLKKLRVKGMILVVDEIDMLFKNFGNTGEEWFSTLIEWCEDTELPFSMIGISNSVNDISATKIRELGHNPNALVFPTYTEADLVSILEKRAGKKIIDTKALKLIAKRVAASTGDARKALEITFNAVDRAFEACEAKWSREVVDADYPLVKLPHMMRAIREGMPTRNEEIIRGLPQAAKVILCIAVSLGKVWGPKTAVSIATLKQYANQATHRSMLDDASHGTISNLIEMLMDSGLLTADHSGNFNANDHSSLLHIGVQLDDVEIALEQSLLEDSSFYRGLVDYVKKNCPRPEYL